MFNLTGSEIVIILLLALVIIGPDKLPEAMRKAGKTWGELRKMSSTFQDEVRKGFDEPTQEMRQTAAAVKKAATINTKPIKGAVKSLLDPPAKSSAKAAVASSATAPVEAGATGAEATVVEATVVEVTGVEAPAVDMPVADVEVVEVVDPVAEDTTMLVEAVAVEAAPDAPSPDAVAGSPIESGPTAEPADPDAPTP